MLVVGLGNPGELYAHTRHNVGFDAAEELAGTLELRLRRSLLRPVRWTGRGALTVALPLTYMNNSGSVIPWLLRRTGRGVSELMVVTDNMDLPAGALRLKRGGQNRSHRGIASILEVLDDDQFLRLYIGIGRPAKDTKVVDHVLSRPVAADENKIREAIAGSARVLSSLLESSPEEVMNDLNRRG